MSSISSAFSWDAVAPTNTQDDDDTEVQQPAKKKKRTEIDLSTSAIHKKSLAGQAHALSLYESGKIPAKLQCQASEQAPKIIRCFGEKHVFKDCLRALLAPQEDQHPVPMPEVSHVWMKAFESDFKDACEEDFVSVPYDLFRQWLRVPIKITAYNPLTSLGTTCKTFYRYAHDQIDHVQISLKVLQSKCLIIHGDDPNSIAQRAQRHGYIRIFNYACQVGDSSTIQLMLDQTTPQMRAVMLRDKTAFGTSLDSNKYTPFIRAVCTIDLHKKKARPRQIRVINVLFDAIKKDGVSRAALVDHGGYNIFFNLSYGEVPAHMKNKRIGFSLLSGRIKKEEDQKVVQEFKALMLQKDANGHTFLTAACLAGNLQIIKETQKYFPDIFAECIEQAPSIADLLTSRHGNEDCVIFLVENGLSLEDVGALTMASLLIISKKRLVAAILSKKPFVLGFHGGFIYDVMTSQNKGEAFDRMAKLLHSNNWQYGEERVTIQDILILFVSQNRSQLGLSQHQQRFLHTCIQHGLDVNSFAPSSRLSSVMMALLVSKEIALEITRAPGFHTNLYNSSVIALAFFDDREKAASNIIAIVNALPKKPVLHNAIKAIIDVALLPGNNPPAVELLKTLLENGLNSNARATENPLTGEWEENPSGVHVIEFITGYINGLMNVENMHYITQIKTGLISTFMQFCMERLNRLPLLNLL